MTLSSQQIRSLRAESHRLKLKPVVMMGLNGFSENVQKELDQALVHHELIKARLPALDKSARNELVALICERLNAEMIQTIGHVAVLFRKNPKSERFNAVLSAVKHSESR